jgi:transposase
VLWNCLPEDYDDDFSIHRTFQRWVNRGVLQRLWAVLVKDCAIEEERMQFVFVRRLVTRWRECRRSFWCRTSRRAFRRNSHRPGRALGSFVMARPASR